MDQQIREFEVLKKKVVQLENEKKQLEQILDASFDGIYVTDGKGTTLFANQAIKRISHVEPKALIGRNMKDLVAEGVFDKSATLQVLKEGKTVTIFQKAASGLTLSTGSPVFDEEGNIIMVITNVRAVNEVHQMREELTVIQKLNEQYHSELASLRLKQMQEEEIITCSKNMFRILDLISKVARLDTTILILGESGVGKELVAKMIHRYSREDKKQSFIKINCGAIPRDLLESELFGYEAGAFTGAGKQGKPGMFELADNGTIFLDEIAELPLDLQAKLLRVLQEHEIIRVGGIETKKINVRVIAATNKDLTLLVKQNKFRDDLYYRLNVLPINVPPLRERKEDIPLIANHFLRMFTKKYEKKISFSHKSIKTMMGYHWPGNVRELQNLVERLVITVDVNLVLLEHLPDNMLLKSGEIEKKQTRLKPLQEAVEEVERELILKAMELYGNTYDAAKALGISQPTMSRKVQKYRKE